MLGVKSPLGEEAFLSPFASSPRYRPTRTSAGTQPRVANLGGLPGRSCVVVLSTRFSVRTDRMGMPSARILLVPAWHDIPLVPDPAQPEQEDFSPRPSFLSSGASEN